MKIYAPVKDTNGIYASVLFKNGVGETDEPYLIEWFKSNGYRVEDEVKFNAPTLVVCGNDFIEETGAKNAQVEPDFDGMTPNDLREWMRDNGYGSKIKNTRNKEKLLEILRG